MGVLKTKPRIALACTGQIGLQALRTILRAGDDARVVAVFTHPIEPPYQQHHRLIETTCAERAIPCFVTKKVSREVCDSVRGIDYLLAVKWRYMIGSEVLQAINDNLIIFHASLLPAYRGFAPVQWPLLNGETKTGVSMFFAAEGVDAGDLIDQQQIDIELLDDAAALDRKVEAAMLSLIERNMPGIAAGRLPRSPQDHSKATYAIWLDREDGRIDWNRSATEIHNKVRAFAHPYSGAFSTIDGKEVILHRTEVVRNSRTYVGNLPGKVERIDPAEGVHVLTGSGILLIRTFRVDGQEMPAASVVTRLKTRFGS